MIYMLLLFTTTDASYHIDHAHVSVLMVIPHNSSHKQNWEVVLAKFSGEHGHEKWSYIGGSSKDESKNPITQAAHYVLYDSLFGDVFSVSLDRMRSYIKINAIYEFIFSNNSYMFVVPFADVVINRYLTGFYDALYHQKRKTRYAKKRGIGSTTINQLALVSWDELMRVVRKSSTGNDITMQAKVASKRIRTKKATPHFEQVTISIDPLLWSQLKSVANKERYKKGVCAGVRIYA